MSCIVGPVALFYLSPREGVLRVEVSIQKTVPPPRLFKPCTMGGYIAPPLKTRFWEDPGHPDYPPAESRKKSAGFPHGGWSSGGNSPLFFRKSATARSGCPGSY